MLRHFFGTSYLVALEPNNFKGRPKQLIIGEVHQNSKKSYGYRAYNTPVEVKQYNSDEKYPSKTGKATTVNLAEVAVYTHYCKMLESEGN